MNPIQKMLFKLRDPEEYKNHEFLRKINQIPHPQLSFPGKEDLHFKHSGNAGDIIYAIPAMLGLADGKNIHLHLNVNQFASYGKKPHPLGNTMLDKKMAEQLQPLLISHPSIKTCDIYTDQPIDFDLDLIRKYPFLLNRGNIARWYFWVFAVNYDLSKAWLQIPNDSLLQDTILVARSQRYNAPGIDYSFLQHYPKLSFIGVPAEFEAMKKMVPHIQYLPVTDFYVMAKYIASCKLFIGNQSFPFAVAEALKVNRLLEIYFQTPNVSVAGANGYDFCFQPQFEKLVKERFM